MKLLLIGIGIGVGFFGTCLIVGNRYFDNLKIDFS